MNQVSFHPIGLIHSPFQATKGMPIQPASAREFCGHIEIFQEYAEGLKDIEGFSHIVLLYHFHLSDGYKLEVKPFLDENIHGVFATRAPRRPNPIGMSVVKLINRVNNILKIGNVDIIDGTPLLDIKPFVPEFDACEEITTGWLRNENQSIIYPANDGRFDTKVINEK